MHSWGGGPSPLLFSTGGGAIPAPPALQKPKRCLLVPRHRHLGRTKANRTLLFSWTYVHDTVAPSGQEYPNGELGLDPWGRLALSEASLLFGLAMHSGIPSPFSLVLRTYPGRLATAGGNGCPSGASVSEGALAQEKLTERAPRPTLVGRCHGRGRSCVRLRVL